MKTYEIEDNNIYTESMTKSLLDKVFFMDKIDTDIIVDYGCADGSLIKFLSTLFPNKRYIGFDIDEKMIALAEGNCPNASFYSDWNKLHIVELQNKETSSILLSSVIHEVYAYGTRKDVEDMWDRVFYTGFNNIIIRDMISSSSMDKAADINDFVNILKKGDQHCIGDFERIWGSIEQNKNLIHFLLKYRYTENWDREVRENYFPITREELLSSIPDEYKITFHDHFILPYLKKVVKKDFGIELKDNTHIKLIMERV